MAEERQRQEAIGAQQESEQAEVIFETNLDPFNANPVLVTRISGGVLNDIKLLHLLFFSGAQIPTSLQGEKKRVLANLVASVLITPNQAKFLKRVLDEYLKDVGDKE